MLPCFLSGGCVAVLIFLVPLSNPVRAQEAPRFLGPDGGFPRQIEATGKYIYAGGPSGFFRTTDAAEWDRMSLPTGRQLDRFFVASRDEDFVYLIDKLGDVYHSSDGGMTWNLHAGEYGMRAVFVHADQPDEIWATSESLYSSGLYKSMDAGDTWIDVNPGDESRTRTRVLINPHAPNHGIAIVSCCAGVVGDLKLFVTRNGGVSWSRGGDSYLETILFHPHLRSTILATSRGKLLRSSDSGLSWEQIGVAPGDVVGWVPGDSNVLFSFSGSDDGVRKAHVFKSTDMGRSWAPVATLEATYPPRQTSVAFRATGEIFIGASPHGVWKSDDGGISWRVSSTGLALTRIYDLEIAEDVLLAGVGGRGILRSTDHGATWKTVINNRSSGSLRSHVRIAGNNAFSNVLPDSVYADRSWTDTGGIAVSGDGGRSWESRRAIKKGPKPFDVSADGSTIYGGARFGSIDGRVVSGLIKSTDEGRTWEELAWGNVLSTVNSIEKVRVDPRSPDRVLVLAALRGAVVDDVLLGTHDGGSSWELLADSVETFVQSPADLDVLYYVKRTTPRSSSNPETFVSTDSGKSWTAGGPLPDPRGFFDVVAHPEERDVLFGATIAGVIVESRDAGASWTTLAGPLHSVWTEIDVSPAAPIRLYGATYEMGAQVLDVPSQAPAAQTPREAHPIMHQLDLNAYPNPSASRASIILDVERSGGVSLTLYNGLGQKIRTLAKGRALRAGRHLIDWDGRDDADRAVPSGVYFLVAEQSDGTRATSVHMVVR